MKDVELTENSFVKLTLKAIVAILAVAAAFTTWMTTMEMRTTAATESIEDMKADSVAIKEALISIDKRLYSIENLLKTNQKGANYGTKK